MNQNKIQVLDHGYVTLRNVAGPTRRPNDEFDGNDVDPANAARFSFDQADQDREREADLKLTGYLLRNRHTTPIEMIEIWLEMKMPIFVARQFVRHRTVSINEISARYVKLEPEFYVPEMKHIGIRGGTSKQGRVITEDTSEEQAAAQHDFRTKLKYHNVASYAQYTQSLDRGIPTELARCFLPVNIYTKWLWNQDLWNMMHFLRLRIGAHAQFESREYANAIHKLLSRVLPHSMKLFDDHIREG